MTYYSKILVLAACTLFAHLAIAQETHDSIRSRIELLPRRDDSMGGHLEYLIGEIKDKALAETARTEHFQKWKVFEDEYIKFSYPDHPNIKLETKTPNDRIPVMGGPVGTTENTCFRNYRLVLGEHTYALLLLEKADDFDDGFCLCGAIAFKKYLFRNGSLSRFDFLDVGKVKKVQMLGKGMRLVMFEWTHLPMTQDAYMDIALGITLKSEPCNQETMRKAMMDKYGLDGRLGFLEKGMNREEIIATLGQPNDSNETSLTFVERDGRWQITTTIQLTQGRFQGFGDNWQTSVQLPAERGTVDWIMETVQGDSLANDSEATPLQAETIQFIFDRFAKIGPTAPDSEWNQLCHAMNNLNDMGYVDKRVLPIVRRRFLEPDVTQHHAAWHLYKCDPEGSKDLFAKRIQLTLEYARNKTASANRKEDSLIFTPYADLNNLLGFIGGSDPRRKAFILEAMEHPHSGIRQDAYCFWDCLPENDAHPRLLHGLSDSNTYVRQRSSKAFAESLGTKADLPQLKECSALEKDKETSENLKTAIARLEAKENENEKGLSQRLGYSLCCTPSSVRFRW